MPTRELFEGPYVSPSGGELSAMPWPIISLAVVGY
jgi:hypothetical protein